jgi:hypothetical protein
VNPFFVKQLSINENEITMYSKNEKFKDLASRTTSYNRHLIMHGHSFNYGCKKNALRAILLLDFICYFIELSRSEQ